MKTCATFLAVLFSACCGGVAYDGHIGKLCTSNDQLMADAFVKSDTAKCNVLDEGYGRVVFEVEDTGTGGLHAARLPCDVSALPDGQYTADVHGETVTFAKPLAGGVAACGQ